MKTQKLFFCIGLTWALISSCAHKSDTPPESHILRTALNSKIEIEREVWPGTIEYWFYFSPTEQVGAVKVLPHLGFSKNRRFKELWDISDQESADLAKELEAGVKAMLYDRISTHAHYLSPHTSLEIFHCLEKRYWHESHFSDSMDRKPMATGSTS